MSADQLLSVAEVAERVGLKHQAVRRAISRGELKAIKLCGRVRIEPSALAAWIDRGRMDDTPQPRALADYPAKSSTRLRSLLHGP